MRTSTLSTSHEQRSPERVKIERILQHFKSQFPHDPITPYAKFFAKRSHADCHGTGLITCLKPEERAPVAELRLCACALRRRDRFVTKALLFDAARARGGLAFAEGTVCDESELALPRKPPNGEAATLRTIGNDAQPEATTP